MNGRRYFVVVIVALFHFVAVRIAESGDGAAREGDSGREVNSLAYCLEMRSQNDKNICTRPRWPGQWLCESGPLNEREARCVRWDEAEISTFCSYWTDGSRYYGREPKSLVFHFLQPGFLCLLDNDRRRPGFSNGTVHE
ncbi:MAG: hypothetical protein C0465_27090 [Ralstonia sp.]|uniref:hypothetical protein n=1 Tax=Ralstonia sp. TaxID=54061 RepID=UPI00257F27F6|nr:hypothetical protein [Ralstonia sp.]MBA4234240.1 hypothetical protein [Ralstonia sp.]